MSTAATGATDRQRIDKWLWHARLVRTRSAAQALAVAGRVRVNRDKIDAASRAVKIGDVLTVALNGRVRVLRVAGFAERRGGAGEARNLYEDIDGSAEPAKPQPPGHGGARPSARERGQILALKHAGALGEGND